MDTLTKRKQKMLQKGSYTLGLLEKKNHKSGFFFLIRRLIGHHATNVLSAKNFNEENQTSAPIVGRKWSKANGRLIDMDALVSKIRYTDNFYETPFVTWADIFKAQTVIPTDKDGET